MKSLSGRSLVCAVSALFILAAIACATEQAELVNTREPTAQDDATPSSSSFGIGDTVRLGDLEITVNGVRSSMGKEFFAPDKGKHFVFIDATIRNTSGEPTTISSLLQMELRDSEGFRYDIDFDAVANVANNSLDGEVPANGILRGESAHQVPIGAAGLVWAFSGDIFSLGEAIFEVGSVAASDTPAVTSGQSAVVIVTATPPASSQLPTPTQTAAPSGAALSPTPTQAPTSTPAPSVFNIGDTVRINNLEVTVNGVRSSFGGDIFTPDEGRYFVYVDATIRNTGSQPVTISSLLQMSLQDSEGFKYDVDFGAATEVQTNSLDGEIPPGGLLRGESAHEVQIGAVGLVWAFAADIFGTGGARFAVGTVVAPTPTPVPPGGSIANAVPVGQTMLGSNGVAILALSVTEDATQLVLDENQFNDPPAAGNRFFIVRLMVTNTSESESIFASGFDFELIGDNRAIYDPRCGVIPDELSGEVFQGGRTEGNVCFEVPVDEGGFILIHQPGFDEKTRRYLDLGM